MVFAVDLAVASALVQEDCGVDVLERIRNVYFINNRIQPVYLYRVPVVARIQIDSQLFVFPVWLIENGGVRPVEQRFPIQIQFKSILIRQSGLFLRDRGLQKPNLDVPEIFKYILVSTTLRSLPPILQFMKSLHYYRLISSVLSYFLLTLIKFVLQQNKLILLQLHLVSTLLDLSLNEVIGVFARSELYGYGLHLQL